MNGGVGGAICDLESRVVGKFVADAGVSVVELVHTVAAVVPVEPAGRRKSARWEPVDSAINILRLNAPLLTQDAVLAEHVSVYTERCSS